jgi:membrane-associated phospholipid phosphatase
MIFKTIAKVLFLFLLTLNLNARDENIAKSGDIIQILIPLGAYGTTFYLDDKKGRVQFYKSFSSTILLTHTLKYTVREERPNGNNTQSFPSGHTSAAFQGASFIHYRYGLKKAILPYLGASFVAYSRVYSKQHYFHDVAAGAFIGTFSNYYFTTKYKDITIKPIAFLNNNVNMYGLRIEF